MRVAGGGSFLDASKALLAAIDRAISEWCADREAGTIAEQLCAAGAPASGGDPGAAVDDRAADLERHRGRNWQAPSWEKSAGEKMQEISSSVVKGGIQI